MNALNQYIDLFEANRNTVEANSPGALNALREQALGALRVVGRLPDSGDEGFEKTSVNDMFAPDFGVNINRLPLPADVAASFRCGVPNLSTLLGVVVNDRFVPSSTLHGNLPEGVTVCPLSQAAVKLPGVLERCYGSVARLSDAGTALNTLLAQDGVLVHVAKGVRAGKAVQIVEILNSTFPLMVARRVLVVAEEGSKIAVLKCDHTQPGSSCCLASEVVEIIAGRDAEVEWYDIEESDASTARYCQVYARQQAGSSLTVCGATLTNGVTRNEFDIEIAGEHTRTRLSGMAIGSGSQHVDNSSNLRHSACHGHSDQLFKYVLDEDATAAFEGSIEVCHGARFVEAYQSNRNILASRSARMHTKPQLLIYNDDVKCSHGATTGQLDAKALFYMQTRGIPLDEARRMLMQAFMVDVIDTIELEPLRDRLRHLVEQRFTGVRAGCRECATGCSATEGDEQ